MKLFRETRKVMIKKRKILNYIFYALGEITLIVIGILLALYLQNRNEEKKLENSIVTTLNLVKDEMRSNKQKIEGVKDYHIMLKDTLSKLDLIIKDREVGRSMGFWKGMRTPRLQNAAFQTSIQTGVSSGFDPNLLKNLNGLYTYQDSYNEFITSSTQIFYNADFTNPESLRKTFTLIKMSMSDLYYFEKELTKSYEETLKEIDSLYPAKK